MIMVYVGPKAKRYSVHEALLTRYEWFRKQILGASNDAGQDSITLRAEDPKAFELLISWLYRKNLKAISTTDEKIFKEEAALHVDLYLRASVWDIFELQNAIMDQLRARQAHSNVLSLQLIKQLFEGTKRHSPIRFYLVDKFCYLVTKLNEDRSRLDPIDISLAPILKPEHHSLLDDGSRAFVTAFYGFLDQRYAKSKIRDPDKKTGCVYHKHMEGERCGL